MDWAVRRDPGEVEPPDDLMEEVAGALIVLDPARSNEC
jgi:hypothetical protein